MHSQNVDNSCLQVVQNEDKLHQKEKTDVLVTRKKKKKDYISHNNSAFIIDSLLAHSFTSFLLSRSPFLPFPTRLPAILHNSSLDQDAIA